MARTQFTKAEADALLGRAARLQAEQAPTDAPLSLDDLKAAAAAAGIDPAFVDLAARTPNLPTPTAPPPTLGLPAGVVRSRYVNGTLTPEVWSRIVSDLRHTLGGKGQAEDGPYRFSWYRAPLQIVAEPQGDLIQFTARGDWRPEVQGLLTLAGALVLAVGSVVGTQLDLPGVPGLVGITGVAALLGLLVGLLWLRPRLQRKEKRVGAKFDAAFDRIAATLARTEAALPEANATAVAPTAPLVPLPDEQEDAEFQHPTQRVRA